jgi:hypothetical protein
MEVGVGERRLAAGLAAGVASGAAEGEQAIKAMPSSRPTQAEIAVLMMCSGFPALPPGTEEPLLSVWV